jgi:hypothetical protein
LLTVCEALSGVGQSGALEGRSPLRPLLFWAALAYELTCAGELLLLWKVITSIFIISIMGKHALADFKHGTKEFAVNRRAVHSL